ncbi:uncharacterized protein PG998_004033 [Apiospora kogelbergensis]|uniref:uncharacterized protein n=1 Tax=Apiospora kogelbergensis TaxID=1337665 RepID=UPI0031327CF8
MLTTKETFSMFADPVPEEGADTNSLDEAKSDAVFRGKLATVHRDESQIWRRMRLREFTIWPIHTSKHFATILIRMRRNNPDAAPQTPYDEVCQLAILEPSHHAATVRRIHRRLRAILAQDGITMAKDAFKSPWYPNQDDEYSCGLRAYKMVKEFMERITFVYSSYPDHFYATYKPVLDQKGKRRPTDIPKDKIQAYSPSGSDTGPQSGKPDAKGNGPVDSAQQLGQTEKEFQDMIWNTPFNGWINEGRVRQEMMGAAAAMGLERYEYRARLGLVPIDYMMDRDVLYDQGLKDTIPVPLEGIRSPTLLRPPKAGKAQQFGAKSAANQDKTLFGSPFQQAQAQQSGSGSGNVNDISANFAGVSIGGKNFKFGAKKDAAAAELDSPAGDAKKRRLNPEPLRQGVADRRPGLWREQKNRHDDRFGPEFGC